VVAQLGQPPGLGRLGGRADVGHQRVEHRVRRVPGQRVEPAMDGAFQCAQAGSAGDQDRAARRSGQEQAHLCRAGRVVQQQKDPPVGHRGAEESGGFLDAGRRVGDTQRTQHPVQGLDRRQRRDPRGGAVEVHVELA
jgi:hypothetical protein